MKQTMLVVAVLSLMAAAPGFAAIDQELFLDAGGGVTATIDVDNLGNILCSGTCVDLVTSLSGPNNDTLQVTGKLGQFTINATGVGGLDAIGSTLQNLNQIEAASTSAGSLTTKFTDTDYCSGGGDCFGTTFVYSSSIVGDTDIDTSTVDFAWFGDAGNSIPAGTLIATTLGLTGLSDAASGSTLNLIGSGGSLTSATVIAFSGAGTIQANMQISTRTAVPEPASVALLGIFAVFAGFKFRRKSQIS